jgi:RimJ/RimL family protein N-acetyltransferase
MIAEFNKHKIVLIGHLVELSEIKESELKLFVRWFKDKIVMKHIYNDYSGITLESEKRWYKQHKKSPRGVVFGIRIRKGRKLIGSISLKNIDRVNNNAEYGIIIGDKKSWNKGYGTEASKLLLNFGFGTMNLESIYLKCNEHNHGAIKAYKKAGFKKQGILRNNRYYNKEYSDSIVMDILKKEFKL